MGDWHGSIYQYGCSFVWLWFSCFSKIHIGFTFLVPAHLGSPGKRAIKRVCVVLAGQAGACGWRSVQQHGG